MENKMFCFQCEQTAGCAGCNGQTGVCGKTADIANLQDKLTGALIGLARVAEKNKPSMSTHRVMLEGLFTTVTNVNFNEKTIKEQMEAVTGEKKTLMQHCPGCEERCVRSADYDMKKLWNADENIRSLKSLILFGLRGMAAYAYHAWMLGYTDEEVNTFFYEGLRAVGEDWNMEQLLPVVLKVGEVNLKCMALLDQANTGTYGTPEPTSVSMKVEKGPFIVISGHDLKDLELLLEQTKGMGINIYTNGEMLPAHAYPKLKE